MFTTAELQLLRSGLLERRKLCSDMHSRCVYMARQTCDHYHSKALEATQWQEQFAEINTLLQKVEQMLKSATETADN